MARLVRAALAIVLLLAFVGDLRILVPVLALVLALGAWRRALPRAEATVGATLLAAATVALQSDNEVPAWTLVLAVAALAGFEAATATGRSREGRRGVGWSSRAR